MSRVLGAGDGLGRGNPAPALFLLLSDPYRLSYAVETSAESPEGEQVDLEDQEGSKSGTSAGNACESGPSE